jgi:hypothetical protein
MRLFKYFLPKSVNKLLTDYLYDLESQLAAGNILTKTLKEEHQKLIKSRAITSATTNPGVVNEAVTKRLYEQIKVYREFLMVKSSEISSFDNIIAKSYFRGFYTGLIVSLIVLIIIKFI